MYTIQKRSRRATLVNSYIKYKIHIPQNVPPESGWPLCTYLHGHRTSFHPDKLDLPFKEFTEFKRMFLLVPECPDWIWWDKQSVHDLILEVIEEHFIDKNRLYLCGFSMGGFCTWDLISSYPNMFAAAVPVSGGSFPFSISQNTTQRGICYCPVSFSLTFANAIGIINETNDINISQLKTSKTAVWTFHSTTDDVIPYKDTSELVNILLERNDKRLTKYTLYDSGTHYTTFDRAFTSPSMFQWMLVHSLELESDKKKELPPPFVNIVR